MTLKLPAREQREVVKGRVLLVDADLLLYLSRDPEEPVQNVLHSVKLMLQEMQENTQCEQMRCIFSSPTNFRYGIEPNYKANRKDKEKPPHYQATKDYLIEHWDAEVARDDWEADDEITDMVGYLTMHGPYSSEEFRDMDIENDPANPDISDGIIASLDKDFLTVCGWHYKWRGHHAGNIFWVNEDDAENFLCYQLLCGDSADNIISPVKPRNKNGALSASGFGHVKARDFLLKYDTPEERMEAVHALYREQGWGNQFQINYKLLAIGRTEV